MSPSPEEIDAARTAAGGWTRETLAGWGVPWPPPKGWRARLIERWEGAHDSIADAAPNCPACGHRLDPEGSTGRERWRCPECGLTRL